MPISFSEQTTLTCPSCGAAFDAEVWLLVDAAERPDLAQALRDGTLDRVTCPRCGFSGPSGAPLLYHHPERKRVYFAAPAGVEEHRWREQAQSLLYVLVGSIPEDSRELYLGDVQIEQEVEGVRRAVLRREGGRSAGDSGHLGRGGAPAPPDPRAQDLAARIPGLSVGVPAAPPPPPADRPATPSSGAVPEAALAPLLEAVQQLLAADSHQEFEAVVAANPALLSEEAEAAFAELIAIAFGEGEREVAEALQAAQGALAALTGPPSATPAETPAPAASATTGRQLSDRAYQALMRSASSDDLLDAVRDHPALLDPWADAELAARSGAALDEGNERLAAAVETRREELAGLRQQLAAEEAVLGAIRALLEAEDEDALARAITDHPILLAEIAQEAMLGLASGARAAGDEDLATFTVERRAMLGEVRAGLERG